VRIGVISDLMAIQPLNYLSITVLTPLASNRIILESTVLDALDYKAQNIDRGYG
jgi:hypothetical protein